MWGEVVAMQQVGSAGAGRRAVVAGTPPAWRARAGSSAAAPAARRRVEAYHPEPRQLWAFEGRGRDRPNMIYKNLPLRSILAECSLAAIIIRFRRMFI